MHPNILKMFLKNAYLLRQDTLAMTCCRGCQSGRGGEVCGQAEKGMRDVAILSSRLIRTRERQIAFKKSLTLRVSSTAQQTF